MPGHQAVAVKALVTRRGRVLLLRRACADERDAGRWDLPGGRTLFGESPAAALRRELREETGLRGHVREPLSVWSVCPGPGVQLVGITFRVTAPRGAPRLSREHDYFAWVNPGRMRRLRMHPQLRAELRSIGAATGRRRAASSR